jgi:hypothetical protein
MRRLALLFVPLLALLLASCGGGGGGGGSTTFTYVTDWTNFSSATGGQSEVVQLFNPAGNLVNSFVANSGTSTTTNTFPSLAAGNYHLMVQLYSGPNQTGTEVGDLDVQVALPTTTTFHAAVGDVVASIKVTPPTDTLSVTQTAYFYAAGYSSGGVATFLPVNSISWTVLGSIGTVSSNGSGTTITSTSALFSPNSPGMGSVQATESTTNFNASSAVTVTPTNAVQGTWTIMVYMNAANDLVSYSANNVAQMQQAASAGNTTRTIVQWKQASTTGTDPNFPFNGTRRYLITPSSGTAVTSSLLQDMGTGVDMGNYQTLTSFINWCKTNYPAQHYCLVMWDHGSGWSRGPSNRMPMAVSFDSDTGNQIETWQLAQGLGNNTFDILAWDASLMQMAEVADEISSKVSYIAGSEESPPGAGYPYNLALKPFYATPNETALQLSDSFVTAMIQGYGTSTTQFITQSVIETSQLPNLCSAVTSLATALDANVGSLGTAIPNVRTNAKSYELSPTRYFYDLYDITSKLDAQTSIPAIAAADAQVRAAVTSAVVWEGHNTLSNGSHGVSIDFEPSSVFTANNSFGTTDQADYALLRFSTDTTWASWLSVSP